MDSQSEALEAVDVYLFRYLLPGISIRLARIESTQSLPFYCWISKIQLEGQYETRKEQMELFSQVFLHPYS
jgi:hypothetical protein